MNEELKEIKEYIIKMKRTYTAFNEDAIGEILVCEEILKYIEYMEERENDKVFYQDEFIGDREDFYDYLDEDDDIMYSYEG